jgi:LPS export ABC transporter protein LptC
MSPIKNKRRPLATFGIAAALTIALVGVTGIIGYRHFFSQKKTENIDSKAVNKANISIGKVHQTSTRDGIVEWRLDAASMNYFAEKNQSVFQDLFVTFYLKDRTEIYLTADQGVLKTASKNMRVRGNVVVKNKDYQLETETLDYNHGKRIITTKVPVKITGDSIGLTADSMSLDLKTKLTVLQGNVKGTLSEKFIL